MLFYKRINPSKIIGIKKVIIWKLSTKGRYGLRALIDLAQNSTEEPVSDHEYCRTAGNFRTVFGTTDVQIEKSGIEEYQGSCRRLYSSDRWKKFQWEIYCVRWRAVWIRWIVRDFRRGMQIGGQLCDEICLETDQ